jgi:hypothetical protein
MNGAALGIALQGKDARATKPSGVVLYDDSRRNTCHCLINKNIILAELLIAVLGDVDVASEHKRLRATQSLTHPLVSPSSGSPLGRLADFSPQAGRSDSSLSPRFQHNCDFRPAHAAYPAAFFRPPELGSRAASLGPAPLAFLPNTPRKNLPV